MASGSGLGSGSSKRPKYVDLDAPTLSNKDPWDTRSLTALSNPLTSLRGARSPRRQGIRTGEEKSTGTQHGSMCCNITSGGRWRC